MSAYAKLVFLKMEIENLLSKIQNTSFETEDEADDILRDIEIIFEKPENIIDEKVN